MDETPNGLNQLVTQGSASLSYDAAGSVTSDGTNSYGYDAENRLISGSAYGVALRYDPLGRLWETASATFGTTRFLTDGAQVAVEYDGATGAIRRRFMFDDDSGAPVLQDEGGALNCGGTRFYQNDERGSAIALADCFGNRTAIDAYDDYGVPSNPTTAIGTAGRYRYTGQAYIPELGMYYYKARIYAPSLGRFMQSDPVGYGGGMNLYAYVRGDPINLTDPLGLVAPDGICVGKPSACTPNNPGPQDPGSSPGFDPGSDAARWRPGIGGPGDLCGLMIGNTVYDIHPCPSITFSGGAVGNYASSDGSGGGGGMGGRLTDPIPAIKVPTARMPNACQSRLYKFGAALNEGGKLGSQFGLAAAAIGAIGGGVGATPGLAAASVGGAFSLGGQVLQDIAVGRSLGSTALSGAASVFGGKLIGALVPSSLRSDLGNALAGEAFGDITEPVLGSGC